MAGGVALLLGAQWWWVPAALGVVLSQILIFGDWSDAKAGTIANVLLLMPIVVAALGSAPWSFRARYEHDVTEGLHQPVTAPKLVTEADIAHLPAAVQRYLVFTGAVGRPQVQNYRLRFGGALRNGPDDKWMPMVAHQQSFVSPPARLFFVEGSMLGVPFDAYHRYVGPEATFQVRAASLVTMVDAHGAEMNHSETVTLFNDMFLLAPATLIDPQITWEELDPLTVRATWTNAGNIGVGRGVVRLNRRTHQLRFRRPLPHCRRQALRAPALVDAGEWVARRRRPQAVWQRGCSVGA